MTPMSLNHYHPVTKEYLPGVEDSEHYTQDPLPALSEGQVAIYNNGWQVEEDYRGQWAYNSTTQETKVVEYTGDIESGWSLGKLYDNEESQTELDNYIKLLETDFLSNPSPDLVDSLSATQVKQMRTAQRDARYSYTMNLIMGGYQRVEIDTWFEQLKQANIWNNYIVANPSVTDTTANYSSVSLLKELTKGRNWIDNTGLTIALMTGMADAIIAKASVFAPFAGGVTGAKHKIEEDVDAVDVNAQDAKQLLLDINPDDIVAVGINLLGL